MGWRWLLGFSAIPLFVLAVGFFFAHESPRWLLAKGREEEAEQVLRSIARSNGSHKALELLQEARLRPISMQEATEGVDPHAISSGAGEQGDDVPAGGVGVEEGGPPEARASGVGLELTGGGGRRHDLERGGAETDGGKKGLGQAGAAEGDDTCAGGCWQSVAGDRSLLGAFVEVLSPPYVLLTLVLWLVWVTNAFTYYGLVLLATQVAVNENGGCPADGSVPLDDGDYASIAIESSAEVPGLMFCAFMIDVIGRKAVQSSSLLVGALSFFLLLGVKEGILRTVVIFVGRAAILSAFTALFIITPELFPTRIRARAFGIANSLSRVGGMVAPFVGQGLVAKGQVRLAVYIFGSMSVVAAIASLFMGKETAGKPLDGDGAGHGEGKSQATGAGEGGKGVDEEGGRRALLGNSAGSGDGSGHGAGAEAAASPEQGLQEGRADRMGSDTYGSIVPQA